MTDQAPLTLGSLRRALSPQRLNGYADAADVDELDAIARYLWNMALAAHLQPVMHVLEVTLRNAIFDMSRKLVDESALNMPDIRCWLDAAPSLLYDHERDEVRTAKSHLGVEPERRTPGHLVAKLSFGFWVQLCSRVYSNLRAGGPKLWPAGLSVAFPYRFPAKSQPSHTEREILFQRLDGLRALRNRAAHLEPIWDRDAMRGYEMACETIGWMNPRVAEATRVTSDFPSVYEAGPVAYRPTAEGLLGTIGK